eukprot:TRINITY_DN15195_c0_g1_i1.p1 TRINITY_DN15195_c0_g1~~TRINITY_DN15195_c0_g1_i1.p1  ORF type:complete len:246 (-),score=44.74 TRINITY_DN15195_c0_g1_i1:430-1167(-)
MRLETCIRSAALLLYLALQGSEGIPCCPDHPPAGWHCTQERGVLSKCPDGEHCVWHGHGKPFCEPWKMVLVKKPTAIKGPAEPDYDESEPDAPWQGEHSGKPMKGSSGGGGGGGGGGRRRPAKTRPKKASGKPQPSKANKYAGWKPLPMLGGELTKRSGAKLKSKSTRRKKKSSGKPSSHVINIQGSAPSHTLLIRNDKNNVHVSSYDYFDHDHYDYEHGEYDDEQDEYGDEEDEYGEEDYYRLV